MNRRLRGKVNQYRKGIVLTGAVAVVLAFALGFVVTQPPEVDPVTLGVGKAGVMSPDSAQATPAPIADTALAEARAPEPALPKAVGPKAAKKAAKPEAKRGREVAGGEASYYGEELAGRPTASGERFNPGALTAAHRTLPFGSRVRVTNLNNGRSIIVRINDRGPFAKRRVIDLSKAAARQIGMLASGTARVRLELLPG